VSFAENEALNVGNSIYMVKSCRELANYLRVSLSLITSCGAYQVRHLLVQEKAGTCIWNRDKLHKLISRLQSLYRIDLGEFVLGSILGGIHGKSSYFELLVAVVLSQNTSDKNAIKAYKNLKKLLGSITPEKIAEADPRELGNAIRVAGLVNRRSQMLKALALAILDNPQIFDYIQQSHVEDGRRKLLELPGVGYKTADVVLLVGFKKPTFPIDTHINRVLRRLGVATAEDGYEEMRRKILDYVGSDVAVLTKLHLLLIIHGRKICRSRAPKCSECIVADLCCRAVQL